MCWRPPTWWLAATIIFVLATIYWLRLRVKVASSVAVVAFVMLGAFDLQLHDTATDVPDAGSFADGRPINITGHVTRDGILRPSSFRSFEQTVELESESITEPDSDSLPSSVGAGVRLNIYYSHTDPTTPATQINPPVLLVGQRVGVTAKLHSPSTFGNPGAWDYRGYLAQQGIVAIGSAKADEVEVLPGFGGSHISAWRAAMRRSVIAHMTALWDSKDAALTTAMITGEHYLIDRATRKDFQSTGVYHILVVAGLHVGILAWAVFWTVRRLRGNEVVSCVVTAIVTMLFALLTELRPPIVRATLMLWIYLAARLLYRDRHALNAISLAALCLLVTDPRAMFDPSFQMSFLAVTAIAGAASPLLQRTARPYRQALANLDSIDYDARLAPRQAQLRLDLRQVRDRLALWISQKAATRLLCSTAGALLRAFEVLVISAVMQVAMVLPMAAYFHRAAVVTIPANTLVVPLTGIALPMALAATALSYIWMPLARLSAWLAAGTLHAIRGTAGSLAGIGLADVRVATPTVFASVAAVMTLVLAIAIMKRHRAWVALALLLMIAADFWTVKSKKPDLHPGSLEITALDVGQGDSIFIATPG